MRDFNDLQFFAAVVLNCGFSASSRALKVPKSRISRHVALLEDRLGVRSLDRSTRRLALTQVGQQVFEHARAAIIEAEAAEDAALRMQAEPRGHVRLSCPFGLQNAITASIAEFLAAHPLLRLQCIVTNRRVDLIHEGIDVAIRVRERLDTDADRQVKRIGISRRILVASPRLPAKGQLTTPAQLAAFPILHQEVQGATRRVLQLRIKPRAFARSPAMPSETVRALARMLRPAAVRGPQDPATPIPSLRYFLHLNLQQLLNNARINIFGNPV
jgi:DNA-binding transcriptional LysR family regulator